MNEALQQDLTFRWSDLPTVTPDLPGVGGVLRHDPEDFLVQELPLYQPSGQGSHAYARVEKVGLTTADLLSALRAAGLPEQRVGVAGLKDKVARTEQWLSVPRQQEAEAWAALEALPGVRLLETSRHQNKLGIGHLQGNAFTIRLRGTEAGAEARALAVLSRLVEVGLPNYLGPQRFGRFGRNAVDGWRLLHGEQVPGGHRLKRFFVTALQSQLFNLWLARRIDDGLYRRLVAGDWARKHDTGGTFLVEDADAESRRAEAMEISATLPLYGKKVKPSPGEAGEREARLLERLSLRWVDLVGRHGDRRITRLPVAGVGGSGGDVTTGPRLDVPTGAPHPLDPDRGGVSAPDAGRSVVVERVVGEGDDLVLRFSLPKGSYATTLLREVMKVEVDAPLESPHTVEEAEDGQDRG